MTSGVDTRLTPAQGMKLDRLARASREDPERTVGEDLEAKVVGWTHAGPMVRRGDGRLQWLAPSGRLMVLREDEPVPAA